MKRQGRRRYRLRMPKRLHVVQIRLDDETLEIMRAEAERQHRAMANLISAVIKDWAEALKGEQK